HEPFAPLEVLWFCHCQVHTAFAAFQVLHGEAGETGVAAGFVHDLLGAIEHANHMVFAARIGEGLVQVGIGAAVVQRTHERADRNSDDHDGDDVASFHLASPADRSACFSSFRNFLSMAKSHSPMPKRITATTATTVLYFPEP